MLTEKTIELLQSRIEPFERFVSAIEAIDEANDEDPKRVQIDSRVLGYELHFGEVLFDRVLDLDRGASEELLLAARGQHICRWKIPREDYPMDRSGYLKWRSDLKRFHASKVREILADARYDEATQERVESLNLKRNLGKDTDCQALEDALCLVFLDLQLAEFRERAAEEKVISILRKTWGKMSEKGHEAALKLDLDEESKRLVEAALSGS